MLKLTTPQGIPITSYHHWKDGRSASACDSAKELVKSWFRNDTPQPPDELLSLLYPNTRLKGLQFTSGVPELVTSLPERGEGRNHDMALICNKQIWHDL